MQKKAFTIIELLVVIAIIAVLASIVLVNVNNVRDKAKMARAKADISQFIKVATVAQIESGKRLQEITGNGCSECVCRGRDIRNILEGDSCYTQWINVLATIQNATGNVSGITGMTRDPWKSPYGLDENEGEGGPTDCRQDTIISAGPDGILWTGDDVRDIVPLLRQPCP